MKVYVSSVLFQYSSLLLVIFVVETSMLICGYLYRNDLTASFHAGLGKARRVNFEFGGLWELVSSVSCCFTPHRPSPAQGPLSADSGDPLLTQDVSLPPAVRTELQKGSGPGK